MKVGDTIERMTGRQNMMRIGDRGVITSMCSISNMTIKGYGGGHDGHNFVIVKPAKPLRRKKVVL